ncbi:MAG: dUTP diphosphatase [Gammaproteobacteria bacterium]|nr:dUTP diphosphatase [Gammaproteobacteria bacterium]
MNAEAVKQRVLRMAALQERHNLEIHSDWREQGYAYCRAIWVECAELLEHYGWKWWKHQQPDLDQVRLEIVDIWHFGLSEMLRDGRIDLAQAHVSGEVIEALQAQDARVEFREAVERLAESSLQTKGFDAQAFAALLTSLPMALDELHGLYIGKNLLNSFRQAHGYADGRYAKIWQGREDNEHLMDILGALDPLQEDFEVKLKAELEARYLGR